MSGLVQCPFDPLHQIAPNKFGKHLTKCQRQHPDMQYARCPLNTFHLVKPEDLKEHVRTCPSRMELEAYKYSVSSASTAPTEELIINTGDLTGAGSSAGAASLQRDEECWDDSNYEAYNPLGKCKQQKEQNRNFIIPCANKFVVPNVSAAMIKEEFQNDTVEERPVVKEEVLSEGDRSPNRCAIIVVKEETPAIEPRAIKSEHSERQDQEPYRGRNYDARDRRSEGLMHQHYERRDRDSVGQRDNGSTRERYQSNGNRHMDRYDRKRDGNSSSRSHEEYRPRYNPYHNPYSQNMRQSRDEKTEASNRHFKIDRNARKH